MARTAKPARQPEEPNRFAAVVLSAVMHLLLVAVLVFGLSWQSRAPEAVSVELWQQLPQPEVVPPPDVKPEPKPEPAPPPPKPVPPPPKPDISLEKEKKPPPRKPEPQKERPLDLDLSRQIKEQANKELEKAERDREKQELLSQFKPLPSPPAGPSGTDTRYAAKLRAAIRPKIVIPPGIAGNPEAVFDVEQLPTGDVASVKLRTSSGNSAYDDAVDRAIRKASPLPPPDPPAQRERHLVLKFRPIE